MPRRERTITMESPGDIVAETQYQDAQGRTVTRYSASQPYTVEEQAARDTQLQAQESQRTAERAFGTMVNNIAMEKARGQLGSMVTKAELEAIKRLLPEE